MSKIHIDQLNRILKYKGFGDELRPKPLLIKCATIRLDAIPLRWEKNPPKVTYNLSINYSIKQLNDFFDFVKNADFNNKQIHSVIGTVWLQNGDWIELDYNYENGQYEWITCFKPDIPDRLKDD